MSDSGTRISRHLAALLAQDGILPAPTASPAQRVSAALVAQRGVLSPGLDTLGAFHAPSLGLARLGAFSDIPTPPRTLAALAGLRSTVPSQDAGAFGLGGLELARKENKRSHDGHLRTLMDMLEAPLSGFDCHRADLDGYAQPKEIHWEGETRGHIPDATAWKGLTRYFFEVETAATIGIEHTRKQCELFAAYARKIGGQFVLYVPYGQEDRARRQLASWRIAGQVW